MFEVLRRTFVAEHSSPSWFAITFPRPGTVAIHASWVGVALIAILAIPANAASGNIEILVINSTSLIRREEILINSFMPG